MTKTQHMTKRAFDFVFALFGLIVIWPVILVTILLAQRDTGASGLFRQVRVGRDGRLFKVNKIRTMRMVEGTTVTVEGDPRITPLGARLRRWKLDELPQLWNVVVGDMSFVGPRPDVAGFMDKLESDDRRILDLRPGITGPATLKYANEEEMLAEVDDPEAYNKTVIWPDKVRINAKYYDNWSLAGDVQLIIRTVVR
ncbi:sugar transferase [bacterium]|nr:sugar transferase [bacterium]